MYEVEYVGDEKYALSSNLIAENMLTQIDEEANRHIIMDEITYHWFVKADVKTQDAFVTTSSGTKRISQTTQGVSLCIKCYDVNTTWLVLKHLKESYPVQLAEYAVAANISMETAFDCWVPHTLQKRDTHNCESEIQVLVEDSQVQNKGPIEYEARNWFRLWEW